MLTDWLVLRHCLLPITPPPSTHTHTHLWPDAGSRDLDQQSDILNSSGEEQIETTQTCSDYWMSRLLLSQETMEMNLVISSYLDRKKLVTLLCLSL
jgi:hypothetical protein